MGSTKTVAALTLAALMAVGYAGDAKPDGPPGRDKQKDTGRARALLTRDDGGVDDNAKGRIDLSVKKNNRSDLRIQAQRLDDGLAVDFTIEDEGGLEVTFATAVAANDQGSAKVFLKSKKNDPMPLDAASAADLVGAVIRVRVNGTGEALLIGTVPSLDGDAKAKMRERVDLVNAAPETDDDAKGRLSASYRGRDGRSELKIVVKNVAPSGTVSFRIDDGAGNFVEVDSATASDDGEAGYRVRTHQGDAMPFGAADVRALGGRAVQVLVDGLVQLTGTIPGDA